MAVVSHSVSTSSGICFNPLQDESNISVFRTYMQVIKTCIGPHGKLKVIQNISGGHTTVTSSSQRLFHNISIKNSILKFIVSSAKTQLKYYNDGGLFCTLLILKLIDNSLLLSYPLPLIGKLYEYFGKEFVDCLSSESNYSVRNLDLGNLSSLQSVIHTVLQSKPACLLTEDDRHHLSVLILKVVLNSIPSEMHYNSNFNIVTLVGIRSKESKLYEGLLIRNSEITNTALPVIKNKKHFKIVVFATSLSGDADFPFETIEVNDNISFWDEVLKFLQNMVSKLITENVNIVACQKVVHPKLRKQLEDANVLVLERLGSELTKYLEYTSGSSAVSSLVSDITYGSLTSLKEETLGKNNFLLLVNEMKPLWTLLICNYNEEVLNETKVVCQQAINMLFRLFKEPKVCFGGGCSDMYTSRLLEKKVKENLAEIKKGMQCSATQIQTTLKVFIQTIVEVALAYHQGSSLDYVTDTVHGHLWKLNDKHFPTGSISCMCGQYLAESVGESAWCFLFSEFCSISDAQPKENLELNKHVILDEHSYRVNGYAVAFDTASLLLRISLCISNM